MVQVTFHITGKRTLMLLADITEPLLGLEKEEALEVVEEDILRIKL